MFVSFTGNESYPCHYHSMPAPSFFTSFLISCSSLQCTSVVLANMYGYFPPQRDCSVWMGKRDARSIVVKNLYLWTRFLPGERTTKVRETEYPLSGLCLHYRFVFHLKDFVHSCALCDTMLRTFRLWSLQEKLLRSSSVLCQKGWTRLILMSDMAQMRQFP